MTDFSSPRVVIRPALPRDIADVAEFTKFIWDGHDYVGEVFPRWLEDPHGQLLAAEYAGHCVGTAKVSLIAPGQWWLEGFRVDPKFQGLKIGSRLDAACNDWWDENGNGVLRLMTSSKRVQVHHLSELRGFIRLGDVLAYEASVLAEKTDAFVPLAPDDVNEAVAFCQRSAPGRMMNLDWRFGTPNADSLRGVADEGLAWWWRGRRGFLSAGGNDDDNATSLTVGLEACAESDPVDLLTDFRRLAFARGMVAAGWINVLDGEMSRILEQAGYKRKWEDAGFLYERLHSEARNS